METYNAAVDMVDRNVTEGRGAKLAFSDPARRLTYIKTPDVVPEVSADRKAKVSRAQACITGFERARYKQYPMVVDLNWTGDRIPEGQ